MTLDLKEQISKFFKGEVEDNEEILIKYSHDASIFELRPLLVLFPMNAEDVQNLVKWVSENKYKYQEEHKIDLSITARCAGTDMSGGAIGESLILDFTRHMNKLISFNGDEITVEPGMFYRDFEKITLEKDLILPCYTASKQLNAMGGMFGNNSAGEHTLQYGQTEKYIVRSKVVFSDGRESVVKPISASEMEAKYLQSDMEGSVYKGLYNIFRRNGVEIENARPKVSKNSSGYYLWNVRQKDGSFDLNKVLVGSQGTLAIATEITFKLVSVQKNSKLVAIFLNNTSNLGQVVDEILETKPATIEAYDDETMKLAVRFFPSFLWKRGLVGGLKFIWSFLPDLKMILSGGFPRLVLLVEFSGKDENEVHNKCLKLAKKIEHFNFKIHISKNKTESEKYWDIRRDSFDLLRKHMKSLRTAPFIDDVIVDPKYLPTFLPELKKLLKEYKIKYSIAGHAGNGNFHIIPLMDFSKKETAQTIMELGEKVYDLVALYKGSITAEHNDGLIRIPYLGRVYNQNILDIFKEVKNLFDPLEILNPGKKVPMKYETDPKRYFKNNIRK